MFSVAHTLVAGAIVSSIPDPVVSLPIVFASHYVMDSIPHWDFGTDWRGRSKFTTGAIAIAETFFGFSVGWLVWGAAIPLVLLLPAMAFSVLPDWLEAPWYLFFAHQDKHGPAKNAGLWEWLTFKMYKAESYFHTKANFIFGIVTQVATVAFFLVLLR
jgi:hypothetical protein